MSPEDHLRDGVLCCQQPHRQAGYQHCQVRTSFFSFLRFYIFHIFSSNLKGLEKYSEAVEAGLARQDCALVYDQCQTSYFGY